MANPLFSFRIFPAINIINLHWSGMSKLAMAMIMVCCSPSPRARRSRAIGGSSLWPQLSPHQHLSRFLSWFTPFYYSMSMFITCCDYYIYYHIYHPHYDNLHLLYLYLLYLCTYYIYIYIFTFSNWLTISSLPPHNTGVNLKIAQPGTRLFIGGVHENHNPVGS